MTRLRCNAVTLGYSRHTIVEGLDLALLDHAVTVVIGANGSGKSTILRALARVLRPARGRVLLDGADISTLPTRDVARRLALLPQGVEAPDGLSVEELVSLGRFPHQRGFGGPTAADRRAVQWALETTGTAPLAQRAVDTLSGGERQRAWIAMTLAQETGLLLLDEPTTALDVGHQLEVLDLVRRLNRERGITIAMVLHDLDHAARYGDHIVALRDGRIAVEGPPRAVFTPQMLAAVFRVHADVIVHERTGALLCVPYDAIPGS